METRRSTRNNNISSSLPSTSRASGSQQSHENSVVSQRTQSSQPVDISPPSTQRSQNLSHVELLHLTGSVVRYICKVEQKKTGILRTNIIKHVLGTNSKSYRQILDSASSTLRNVFGLQIVELDKNKLILVNTIKNATPHIDLNPEEKSQKVLLFLILAVIFVNGESCKEDILQDYLRRLGIVNTNCTDPYFGNVNALISEDFVKQHYLVVTSDESIDPPLVTYKWGVRAKHEVPVRSIMKLLSEMYGDRPFTCWPNLNKIMLEREAEMAHSV